MAPLRLILAISCICAGCATKLLPRTPGPDLPHGTVRLLDSEPGMAHVIIQAMVAAAPPAGRPPAATDQAGCRTIRLGRDEDGQPIAGQLLDAWQDALSESKSAHGWLLEPVDGAREVVLGAAERVSGLSTESEEQLVVCFHRPTPDWPLRLTHPALWPESGGAGAGTFRWSNGGEALVRRMAGPGQRRQRVRRVQIVVGDGDQSFDLAVVYGRAAGRLLEHDDGALRVERIPRWDVSYALWLNPDARWTNDPSFRRWLSAVIDRDSTARYLFGEQAQAATSLIGGSGVEHQAGKRPFSATSSPRLILSYEDLDRNAASLAARVKAVLERSGVAVRLVTGPVDQRWSIVLVAHRPQVADPLLGLLGTLWPLGESAQEEIVRLDRATRIPHDGRRRERALAIEQSWLTDARMIPLVRVHAWLARHSRLSGVQVGAFGILRLDRAEWRR